MTKLTCFKAYDIRGKLGEELNEDIAYKIGRAYGQIYQPKTVVIGCDIRLSSEGLKQATICGLNDAGVNVLDLGMTGTEEVYFGAFHLDVQGGIEVTASHNPMDYNGMKLVREESRPISGDTGLEEIRRIAERNEFAEVVTKGTISKQDTKTAYLEHLLTYVQKDSLKPLKIVCNAGNGGAGAVIGLLEQHLPFEFIKVHHEADGNFPNGVPNPLLQENRQPTIDAIRKHHADLGIAWDGDFDRCFFFDENGRFIEGYYIVGLLAQRFLQEQTGASIVHDPRLIWNTIEIADTLGGTAIQCKTGHAFIKERMRAEDAVYGGEMSAHHYFRDFFYCDSGMVPWLLVVGLMVRQGKSLSELVNERITAYPVSGEINHSVEDPGKLIEAIEQRYSPGAESVDHTDGLSICFEKWRFNLRMSNTEPVLRLNVESRGDGALMRAKTDELIAIIES